MVPGELQLNYVTNQRTIKPQLYRTSLTRRAAWPLIPCVPQTARQRGHAQIPLMLKSPRAGAVVAWEGIERCERYWICSMLPALLRDFFFLCALISASIFFVGMRAEI